MRATILLFCLLGLSGVRGFAQSETMLTGKIRNAAGSSLSGCRVHVVGCEKQDSTGRDGIYRLSLSPGKYELELFQAGIFMLRRKVDIPQDDFCEVDFVVSTP